MARGGGTGSRTKQKKKSETPQNGTVNGQPETEQKQMNKLSKHRKQKVGVMLLCFFWMYLLKFFVFSQQNGNVFLLISFSSHKKPSMLGYNYEV